MFYYRVYLTLTQCLTILLIQIIINELNETMQNYGDLDVIKLYL